MYIRITLTVIFGGLICMPHSMHVIYMYATTVNEWISQKFKMVETNGLQTDWKTI